MGKKRQVIILHNSMKTLLVFREHYIKELIQGEYQVFCIAPADDEDSCKSLENLGGIVVKASSTGLFNRIISLNYYCLKVLVANRFKPTVVCHFLSTITFCSPTLLLARKNICFVEGIGTFFSSSPVFLRILSLLLATVSRTTIYMNGYERELLGKKNQTVLYGIGVDLKKFVPKSSSREKEVSVTPLRLLFVGRLIRDKGIYDVVEVFRRLTNDNIDALLTIVGDTYPENPGSLSFEDIENIQSEFSDKVRFTGYSDDIVQYYQNSDVLLLLSEHEGFSVVSMEANACGIPVLAYDVPGCNEAIVNGVNGFLVEKGGVEDVVKLLSDGIPASINWSSRRYAVDNFDQREKTKTIVNTIEKVSTKIENK